MTIDAEYRHHSTHVNTVFAQYVRARVSRHRQHTTPVTGLRKPDCSPQNLNGITLGRLPASASCRSTPHTCGCNPLESGQVAIVECSPQSHACLSRVRLVVCMKLARTVSKAPQACDPSQAVRLRFPDPILSSRTADRATLAVCFHGGSVEGQQATPSSVHLPYANM